MRRQALADLPERLSLTSAAEAVAGCEGLGKKTVRHERSQLRTRRGLDGSLAQVLQSQLAVCEGTWFDVPRPAAHGWTRRSRGTR